MIKSDKQWTTRKWMNNIIFFKFASVLQLAQSTQAAQTSGRTCAQLFCAYPSPAAFYNTRVCTYPLEPTTWKGPSGFVDTWDKWWHAGNYWQEHLGGPYHRSARDLLGCRGGKPRGLTKWPEWPGVQYGAPHHPLSTANYIGQRNSGVASLPLDNGLNHVKDPCITWMVM